ncbi:transposase [Roseibium algae]|uniref:Transposase n=1 Tax=Roseibium algae TaxID=3123038 RepID=A0ABU8TQQ4_9HYPH
MPDQQRLTENSSYFLLRIRSKTVACKNGWSSIEAWLADNMLASQIHRRKPKGKPIPQATARANTRKSAIRARVEHVFAHQKTRYGLFVRTIGQARAEAKLTLANLAYNFGRLIFHERKNAMESIRRNGGETTQTRPRSARTGPKRLLS